MPAYNFNTVPTQRSASSAEPRLFSLPPDFVEYPNSLPRDVSHNSEDRVSSQPLTRTNTLPYSRPDPWPETFEQASQPAPNHLWTVPSAPKVEPYTGQVWTQPPSYPTPVSTNAGSTFAWPLPAQSGPIDRRPSGQYSTSWRTPSTGGPHSLQWPTPTSTKAQLPPSQASATSPLITQAAPVSRNQPSSRSAEPWILRGSCACAFIQYELSAGQSELPLQACYCHCAVCRNLSGSNFVAFTSVPSERLRWFAGQWDWRTMRGAEITNTLQQARDQFTFGKAPGFRVVTASSEVAKGKRSMPAFGAAPWEMETDDVGGSYSSAPRHPTDASQTQSDEGRRQSNSDEPVIRLWSSSRKAVRGSCARCGSNLFISYHSNVRTTDIALGTLWSTEEKGVALVKPIMHIMLREKAAWEAIPEDGLQKFEGMPGEAENWRHDNNDGSDRGKGKKRKRTQEERQRGIKHLVKCLMVY